MAIKVWIRGPRGIGQVTVAKKATIDGQDYVKVSVDDGLTWSWMTVERLNSIRVELDESEAQDVQSLEDL